MRSRMRPRNSGIVVLDLGDEGTSSPAQRGVRFLGAGGGALVPTSVTETCLTQRHSSRLRSGMTPGPRAINMRCFTV